MNKTDQRPAHGPYGSAAQALCDADHVYAANRAAGRPRGLVDRINEGLILGALREAGAELGAFDREIAGWLAEWEPAAVQAVIAWVERARAGRDGGE